jgi:hypothetical protein
LADHDKKYRHDVFIQFGQEAFTRIAARSNQTASALGTSQPSLLPLMSSFYDIHACRLGGVPRGRGEWSVAENYKNTIRQALT